jgi:hypothetical protein
MVDESLDCLSHSQYSDRAWSLDAFVQYAHLRVISAEFGVIRRLWRGSRDQCLLSDCCMVSLNLFVCGKCRLVAVSVGEHVSFLWKRFFDFLGCFEL